jgi:hypothetical protein
MTANPADWSTNPTDNAHLPLRERQLNGVKVTLSRDESNALYAEWATEHAATQSAATDPNNLPLNRIQFMAMVEILGKTAAIETAINGIADVQQRAVAKAKFYHSSRYDRADPLFDTLAPAVGLTDAEIDAAWLQAAAIQ